MKYTENDFWKPKPQLWGWRTWSLLLPSLASALGFFAFAVLAFSFTELMALSPNFRKTLVLIGAFSLATGGEIGTLSAVVEIFRKAGSEKKAQRWDWAGLVVSILATLAAFLLAFATLLGESATWSRPVRVWGAIVLGLFAALDSYVNFAEFGLFLSTFDRRMQEWEGEYHAWCKAIAQQTGWAVREQAATESPVEPIPVTTQFDVPPPLPLSSDGDSGLCWCGEQCESTEEYLAHLEQVHLYETEYASNGLRHQSAVAGRQVLTNKYILTTAAARWEFPSLEEVRQMREQARQRWPEPIQKDR